MNYYLQTRDGKILKGKADSWREVWFGMPFGSKLFNPYTGRTVIGWNKYKAEMSTGQKQKYGKQAQRYKYE